MGLFQDKLYQKIIFQKPKIMIGFKIVYFILVLFCLSGLYFLSTNKETSGWYYEWGVIMGRTALVLLGIVILPGILGRFDIQIKLTRIITVFRRQLGILTFLLAITHYLLVRLFLYITGIIQFKLPLPLFEIIGMSAFYTMCLLFFTSNNTSVKKLGRWWKRLHRLIYIIVWLVVIHTALQRVSIWSFFIGVFAILETVSLVYSSIIRKRI